MRKCATNVSTGELMLALSIELFWSMEDYIVDLARELHILARVIKTNFSVTRNLRWTSFNFNNSTVIDPDIFRDLERTTDTHPTVLVHYWNEGSDKESSVTFSQATLDKYDHDGLDLYTT